MSTCAGGPGEDTRTTGTAHRARLQVTRPGLLHPRGTPPVSRGTRGYGGFPPSSPQEGAPDRPEAGVQPGPVGTFVTPQSPPLMGPSSLSGHPGGQISVWQESPATCQCPGTGVNLVAKPRGPPASSDRLCQETPERVSRTGKLI
ncbi:hypothetical protein GHT09_001166 [Marmota monax]|uniref:Uncharacterized protein n=1 Tax=Marmota monax TaxID=9995 RepID=A0A834PW51_MARMO|nr:hypothetical protein GHT09_001166 [Marmota monax]